MFDIMSKYSFSSSKNFLVTIDEESLDIVFSDQLIEHFHPEETELHFRLVNRILKKGGKYIFRTPHALTGPHDISKYFCDEPEGFHLKEWTFSELNIVSASENLPPLIAIIANSLSIVSYFYVANLRKLL